MIGSKRIGALLAILLLATAGACAFAPAAHAQSAPASGAGTDAWDLSSGPSGSSGTTATPPSPGTPSTGGASTGGSSGSGGGVAGSISGFFAYIFAAIASIFAWLFGVAALILDTAVYYTIVKMGTFFNESQGGVRAISVAWGILRNIGNIALIFGFVLAGIAIILDMPIFGYNSKMLPMLLVAAVFINFSLFVSEVVIDAGNLVATEIYTQINNGQLPNPQCFSGGTNANCSGQSSGGALGLNRAAMNEGISNRIMSVLGLQALYWNANTNAQTGNIQQNTGISKSMLVSFLAILLFLVGAFVFFSLAFIVVARFVALLFIVILAPVGFAGMIVPGLKKIAGKWWNQLIEQTITAPILILLLYIALAIITDANFFAVGGFAKGGGLGVTACTWEGLTGISMNGSACSSTATALQSGIGVLLIFIVAMGLLLYVVIASKQLGAWGGTWATRMGGRASFGFTAALARNTVGAGSAGLAQRLRKTRFARIPVLGTRTVRSLEGLSKSSFDVRGVKAANKRLEAGDAQKGGYVAARKEAVEARTKYAGGLKGKDFKDLSAEDKFTLANLEKGLEDKKKALKSARTAADYKTKADEVEQAEKDIDKFHEAKGTERGNKLKYGETLSALKVPVLWTVNAEAGKKIKEDARKTKDDKDLEGLRKALAKASGEEAAPAGGGAAAGGAAGAAGGAAADAH
ncbi:MAG: hypothetical protein KGI78_02885 [Patescibacteria group bacterium]|nr:hypothetical protein [Patescibacteria group bacterium]MDE1944562.1 hypothetical protein [Patescibacteria group bacterium]MDE1945418.1 hypothetical protein [Patescibacteria group bacterium]MDE2057775.1 hypothetical protein [Patescibacteria group bacterium]